MWNIFSSSVWWPRSLLSVEDLLDGTTDGVLAPDGDWLAKVRRAAMPSPIRSAAPRLDVLDRQLKRL